MTLCKQKTLAGEYEFHGKGLHTGRISTMTLKPAPENTGIVFHRIDLGESAFVEALAENVSSTARSTTISKGEASVATIEHLMPGFQRIFGIFRTCGNRVLFNAFENGAVRAYNVKSAFLLR